MSTASRLISGSAASWGQIAVTMFSQVALVPIYLSHWSVLTYGTWIAVQAMVTIISTLDFGHQEFLGYEFLRIGRENRTELSAYIWSGASVGLLISVLQLVLLLGFLNTGALPKLLGKADAMSPSLLHDAGLVLVFQGIAWLLGISMTGLLFRALAPFGYYPRMVWWNLCGTILSALAPVVAVVRGADLLTTGFVVAAVSVAFSVPLYIDLFRLLRLEQIPFRVPSAKLGMRNFLRSLALSSNGLLENTRQQGVRLVLAPLAGAAGLTAFSTMRTGANVALQGLNTVVKSIMPELMRFIHQRDQTRIESAFGTVWFVLVAVLAPAMVVIQAFVEPLYMLWTRGHVPFEPRLFAALSLSVLVSAVAQPAIAVVKGNIMLRHQLFISTIAALAVIGGIYLLVPTMGILGGGVALLTAETIAALSYQFFARRWLHSNGLQWPKQHYLIATASVAIAAVALCTLVLFPQVKWPILSISMLLLFGNFWRYWKAMPELATQHAVRIVNKIPGIRRVYAFGKF